MAVYFAFVAAACALQAIADESVESPHKSLMRRKESHTDGGPMTLTISDSGGIRGSKGSADASIGSDNEASHARQRELSRIFSGAHERFREIIKSPSFLDADHEAFHTSIDHVRKLTKLTISNRIGASHGNLKQVSAQSQKTEQRRAKGINELVGGSSDESSKDKDSEEGEGEPEPEPYCKFANKTCLPNLDYAYGPMDDPMLFNSYADAQACWSYKVQAKCFGKGCTWRDGQCHYAVPNATTHAIMVEHMPSNNCGWFAKLERPRMCQGFAIEDCPKELEPCTDGVMYTHSHFGPEAFCEPKEVCDADLEKSSNMLCEEPLVDIYVKCFTEVNKAGHEGTKREREEVKCVSKICPDYGAILEFGYTAGKLCPRFDAELEGCERQANCSYDDKGGNCIPDSKQMMFDRIPKNCRYHDAFQKIKKCSTTVQGLCTHADCDWMEASPCTGNDTVPQFECDVKNNVLIKTIIDNTDDAHLLTWAQAITAKDVCLANSEEDSCAKATPMERGMYVEGAAWRPHVAVLSLVIAFISLGNLV